MSTEQMRWLLKVIQPERTLASLPGGAGLSQETHAALLGLPPEVYAAELSRMRAAAKNAAAEHTRMQPVAYDRHHCGNQLGSVLVVRVEHDNDVGTRG